jgi:CheY-like chemotaxis protein
MTKFTNHKNFVLYADDDPDDLELVKTAFDVYARNVEVVTAKDGGQALSYLDKLSESDTIPCLIILDVNMPVIDGKQVLVKIREMERFNSVPVVLFTTSSMPADKTFAAIYDAGFITKPLNMQQMERITEQFIGHCSEEVRNNIRRQMQ